MFRIGAKEMVQKPSARPKPREVYFILGNWWNSLMNRPLSLDIWKSYNYLVALFEKGVVAMKFYRAAENCYNIY